MLEAEDKDSLELMSPYLGVKKAPPGPRILKHKAHVYETEYKRSLYRLNKDIFLAPHGDI